MQFAGWFGKRAPTNEKRAGIRADPLAILPIGVTPHAGNV
jgi:hypothetical protein